MTEEIWKGVKVHYVENSTIGWGGEMYPEMPGVTIEIDVKGKFFGQIPLRGISMDELMKRTELYTAVHALISNWLFGRGIIKSN